MTDFETDFEKIIEEKEVKKTYDKYNLEQAQELYNYLADKLAGFDSLAACPSPENYLLDIPKNKEYIETTFKRLEGKSADDELAKFIKTNQLTLYLIYMYNFVIQEKLE
jgi:hypothetical protein